ncbi:hypothetical protein sos41_14700 [Alphaproteobacteria bacterium SO-S41]|nr:hypothetical protein sos41_14700 [Alphaproteobacteria bacterium SO-S41]
MMGLQMRQTAAKAILSYWQAIAPEAGGAPAHATVEPRALKAQLPDLFLVERLDRAVFAFRLAGTRLCARYGRELRDHDFVRLWPAAQQGEILAQLNRCLQTAQPVMLRGVAATLDGKPVGFEIVLMPLTDAEGRATRVLGAMLTDDDKALRDGAILISQRLENSSDAADYERALEDASSAAFSKARETKVSFLRVVDGLKDERVAAKAPGQTLAAG